MPNIYAFRSVVHGKKIFKGFYYINLYKMFQFVSKIISQKIIMENLSPWGGAIHDPSNFI